MTMTSERKKSTSLFDDIFKLQSAAPELDIDPEDPEDGFKSGLTEGEIEGESLGPSLLRKQTAIIPDDPKYKGKKTTRKSLYSDDDDENQNTELSDAENDDGWEDDSDEEVGSSDNESEGESMEEGMDSEDEREALNEGKMDDKTDEEEGAVIMAPSTSNDREKGKAVSHQLDVWDNVIKCRISLQKVVSASNRLPTCDEWAGFAANDDFHQLSSNVHSSVRKVLSSLLDFQDLLQGKNTVSKTSSQGDIVSDEDITSESESEEKDVKEEVTQREDEEHKEEEEDLSVEGEEKSEDNQEREMTVPGRTRMSGKRKLDAESVEEVLSKRHQDFQSYRNDTLAKWDEKTRLSHAKIKSKNFAAFDMSVLKQIQQVLANRSRLIRRIHQNRSTHRILGQPEKDEQSQTFEETVEDDDDEIQLRQKAKQELPIDEEIIDDSDFYHICLRDLIELKQNEETDPILANKHWLEIQRLRNKHKRKVDTRASKGRKIRYNVKEKLKNYMAPYDKSFWSEEQREDLFKALFGGQREQETGEAGKGESVEPLTINIGL